MNEGKDAIAPSRSEDYTQWYIKVINAAELADTSPVRGCMVIKPWGYALWDNIRQLLDDRLKETGHINAYFPLLIPKSYLEREYKHVAGFAKECAVVTHSCLIDDGKGGLIPNGKLEDPLIIRPTSETIIGDTYRKWIQSYRDLPLLIYQWANVVRWEMRPRLFLRNSEFLWQEGHTVHATAEEAINETKLILDLYVNFTENVMAMPVIKGVKTDRERFPGAESTYSIESMMQDRKALQSGTSHFLGLNFTKVYGIKFLNTHSILQLAWTTSWATSTRLVGALIMTHSDDNGLVIPPGLSPKHVIILPVLHNKNNFSKIIEYAKSITKELKKQYYAGKPISVELDTRYLPGGIKRWQWIKKGAPILAEVGISDVEEDSVFITYRYNLQKVLISRRELVTTIASKLVIIQNRLFERALAFRDANTHIINSKDDFIDFFTPINSRKPEIHGGFALCHWSGSTEEEVFLSKYHKVSIRCITTDTWYTPGMCYFTGRTSYRRVLFAKSY